MLATNVKLPPSFDYETYRKDKPFLRLREEAYEHFMTVGKREGLKGSPACDQGYLLKFLRNLHPEKILEIGPGSAPKFKGPNVRYFDVKSREELAQRYKNDPNASQLPDQIHYVDPSGSLSCVREKFDIVLSSHVIEHTLDLLAHLREVESILSRGGLYVVIAPNKRFTFDYFKPITIIEDVLSKHFERSRPPSLSLRSVLLEVNRRTHNFPDRHWAGDHGAPCFNKQDTLKSIASFDSTAKNSVAVSGYHNWIFTDDSFVEIINLLHELELNLLRVRESYNTPFGGMSFSAILGRSAD